MKTGAFLMGFSFLVSKILGLIRDNLLAGSFGAFARDGSALHNLDVYYAAFRIPDLLFNLVSYGVLSAAFVPLFVEMLKKNGKTEAFPFANEVLHTFGLGVSAVCLFVAVFAAPLLKVFVPGFSPEDFAVTVTLTRFLMVTPVLFTIGSVAGGIQNSLHSFLGLALAPVMYNLGIIGGIIFGANDFGVMGVATGVAAGAFLHMAVQIPPVFRAGYRYRLPQAWWSPRMKEMLLLSLPRILGMSVQQLSLVVDTVIASTLAAGSITVINFASNLESLPMGLIGISVAVASFATLAGFAAENRTADLAREVRENLRRILSLLIPLTAGMLLLRREIVELILEHGKFTAADTLMTADTLGALLPGLAFGGIVFLLARAFYALKNTKIPVAASVSAVTVNIVLSLVFTKIFSLSTYGLALANSAADMLNATVLVVLLSKHLQSKILDGRALWQFAAATGVMSAAVAVTKPLLETVWLKIAATTLLGAVIYFGVLLLLMRATGKKPQSAV